MKTLIIGSVLSGLLLGPLAMAQDADVDRSHPGDFMKDSAITTKIKSKLAADHLTSLGRIHVDTDANGVVWLTGSARSQEAIDHALAVAKDTSGVRDVKSSLVIKQDD